MENMEVFVGEEEAMDLPPGFRFHPTDEELISDYLSPKVLDTTFSARAIGEVDLNKCEPWELPRHAKMGEKEWYFYCARDRKYPTGLRTNRATETGYWKATGKDKEIFRDKFLVGMKKTLVFYKGRAPKGEKSNWVMHEYRLDGQASLQNLPSNAKNEWTICRVFHKNESGKKIPFPELSNADHVPSGNLPPLMESSPYSTTNAPNNGVSHVSCFSNPMNIPTNSSSKNHYNSGYVSNSFYSNPFHYGDNYLSTIGGSNSYLQSQTSHFQGNYVMTEQNMKTEDVNYSALQDVGLRTDVNAEMSTGVSNYDMGRRPFDDPDNPSTSSRGPVDLENLWNY